MQRCPFYLLLVPAAIAPVTCIFAEPNPVRVRYDNHRLVQVTLKTPDDIKRILKISPDPWADETKLGENLFRVPPDRMAELETSELAYTIIHNNIQQLIDQYRPDPAKQAVGWFSDFKRVEVVYDYLDSLVALRPDLVTKLDIGLTLEGRMIHGMRISATSEESGSPSLLFNGCLHAREWITPMTTMYIADQLIRNYDTDPEVRSLLDQLVFYIVPIVNLDGHIYSWDVERLWRKNRRDNGDGTFGVDLNRNWGFNWGNDASSSGDPNSILFRGTAPFSEPETQVMRDFILGRPEILAHIDFHCYGQIFISPFGDVGGEPPEPDRTTFRKLNDQLEEAVFGVHGQTYEGIPSGGYLSGGFACWTHASQDILSWTFELRDNGTYGFLLPADQILATAEENYAAIKVLANFVAQPFEFRFPSGVPSRLTPNETTSIPVDIVEISELLEASSAKMFIRPAADSAFFETDLMNLGGANFESTLPASSCDTTMHYFFQANSISGDRILSPDSPPSTMYSTEVLDVVNVFYDTMEVDSGWTVGDLGDTATTGIWERVDPIGTAAQPEDDHSATGTMCWVTGQGTIGGELGENDVDGGKTTLMSPVFDLAQSDAMIRYARWYSNTTGSTPNTDTFVIDITNDAGNTWVNVETIGPGGAGTDGGWFDHEFRVSDLVTPTDSIQMRFTASDYADGSLVEAAIDDFSVDILYCPPRALSVTPEGSRYVRVIPPSGVNPIALRLTSTDHPCVDQFINEDGHLVNTPTYQTPDQWGITHVHGREVIPQSQYMISAEDMGGVVIESASATTGVWGDAVGLIENGGWSSPEGTVNVLDLTASLDRFKNLFLAPVTPWCDSYPEFPDGTITILDITYMLDAFGGQPYPFDPPCPPG